jgi:nucleoside-diphosphate-sugar epimerase
MAVHMWRIGITGGSGFIGNSLARHLNKSHTVRVLDVNPPPNLDDFEFRECDIRNYDAVKYHAKDLDFLIHSAIVQIPLINDQKKLGYEVNFLGTQNVCKVVDESPGLKGMILTSSWHTIGERELTGTINEEFGFRPDKVEERARLYALSKMAQEAIVRFYDEISQKFYGIIRMGTVLGEGMPTKTAANIFIEQAIKGQPLTPYKHSMYRPMLYVDISDVCKSYEIYISKILSNEAKKTSNSLDRILNIYYPEPITILGLAEIVRDAVVKYTKGKTRPKIDIVDKDLPLLFSEGDKNKIKPVIDKAKAFLGLDELVSPKVSIEKLVSNKLKA